MNAMLSQDYMKDVHAFSMNLFTHATEIYISTKTRALRCNSRAETRFNELKQCPPAERKVPSSEHEVTADIKFEVGDIQARSSTRLFFYDTVRKHEP